MQNPFQKRGSLTGQVLHLVTQTWSAPSKAIGFRDIQTFYWPFFIYSTSRAFLRAVEPQRDGFRPHLERELLDRLKPQWLVQRR